MQAAIMYMELAEMGFGIAQLNLALLLERVDIFDGDRTVVGRLSKSVLSEDFNINKQIALKYLQLALYSPEIESEASLKIAEFLYYGTSGIIDHKNAISIYKIVEDMSSSGEIKGHALFKLGMIYQFGNE